MNAIVLLVLTLFAATCPFCVAVDDSAGCATVVGRLRSVEDIKRIEVLHDAYQDRVKGTKELLSIMNDASNSLSLRCSAIYLLGLWRLDRGIPELSKNIALKVPATKDKTYMLWGGYPVVHTLIMIGSPAVPAMLALIRGSADIETRRLATTVIRYVEGPEVAQILLQNASEKETDPEKKERLKGALQFVENGDVGSRLPAQWK